jgi:molecular chaperone GrpE (heat shock protein)
MIFSRFLKRQKNPAAPQCGESQTIHENLIDIGSRLRKMESKQKEISVQLDEINDFMQSDRGEVMGALIAVMDVVEDFCRFAADTADLSLREQAGMMWDSAKGKAEEIGLDIIDDESNPFDFTRNSAENTVVDPDLPAGIITKTLKCGYIFNGNIIRRAVVTVNRING